MTAYKSLLLRQTRGMNLLALMIRDGERHNLELDVETLKRRIGSIYFGVMISATIANILTFLVSFIFLHSILCYLRPIVQYGGVSYSLTTSM